MLKDFEALIQSASAQKYSSYPPAARELLVREHPLTRWDLLALFDRYVDTAHYPVDRLSQLVYHLIDIKLQLYFLLEVDIGLQNTLVFDSGYDAALPRNTPHVFLTRLALDQSLIVKSRILWERIMNCLYFLETGEDLETKASRRRSKRKVFFDEMTKTENWRFLEPYAVVLQTYEDAYRSPEVHKASVLRAELMGTSSVDTNSLLSLVNMTLNALWENLMSIVGGGGPVAFTKLHMADDGTVDEVYLGHQAP